MPNFVGHNTAQFFGRKQAHNALGNSNNGIFGVAARGKGVGGFLWHNAHAGLGNTRVVGKFFNNFVQVGGFFGRELARFVHGEHDFVRIPVAAYIHDQGEAKGQYDTCAATHQAAEHDYDGGKQGKQKNSLDLAGHAFSSQAIFCSGYYRMLLSL